MTDNAQHEILWQHDAWLALDEFGTAIVFAPEHEDAAERYKNQHGGTTERRETADYDGFCGWRKILSDGSTLDYVISEDPVAHGNAHATPKR